MASVRGYAPGRWRRRNVWRIDERRLGHQVRNTDGYVRRRARRVQVLEEGPRRDEEPVSDANGEGVQPARVVALAGGALRPGDRDPGEHRDPAARRSAGGARTRGWRHRHLG